MSAAPDDPRVERTLAALRQAFVALFFAHGYDEISVADIAARAGVGRSTLYEHYRGKEDLLLDTVRYPFEGLAVAVDADADPARLLATLQHFWSNRANARAYRRESSRRAMARVLAILIERQLAHLHPSAPAPRRRAAAVYVAEAMFGTISAWLAGDLMLVAPELARVLREMALRDCAALLGQGGTLEASAP